MPPLPFIDNLNSFFAVVLPPIEAFIHHSMPAMIFVFNLTKNPVGFSVANGESVIEHLRFLSDYRFILHQKWNNVHQKVEEAVGFEPTVPAKVRQFSRLYQSTSLTRFLMVIPAGFEPAAPSLEGSCSIQLSYGTFNF